MNIKYCFIKEEYFKLHNDYINMLDAGNTLKQSRRSHLCLCIESNDNNFLIPLRNNLGEDLRKFGRIGHSIPSEKRGKAGLDYRYALVINDDKYLEWQNERKIPRSQYRAIERDISHIKKEFEIYLNGYIKAYKKKRVNKEPLYRVSSLINYNKELKLN